MKKFTVTFWRTNPQLKNGGYEKTKTIEAKTENSAKKKAEKIANDCVYGSMRVIDIEEN